ncbi:hypothetical protein [Arenibacter amylolyticus]|uniref:hypothetical protein n=1 Tax=Arenibacter amylolyticus TaxID=1406873 RepID=UPI000A36F3F5|nr:hypothetical protein [Arenibacter amylolyticus]
MKKLLSYFGYISMLLLLIGLGACQEEIEELPEGNNQEAINASSSTAKLVKRASARDGSYDDIIDDSSCFAINFPYVVNVNGLEVKINSKEDLKFVKDLLGGVAFDRSILNIVFPVTITFSDYSEITIANMGQMKELAESCRKGGDDDDIDCVEFVYPITVYSFDVNLQQTGSVSVANDMQLRRYFKDLKDDQLVSFQFPITLKLYNDTEVRVNSNAEMAEVIENAKDECEDDDDDDEKERDFTLERLNEYLVACPWLMKEVETKDQNNTPQYFDNLMNFKEDGTVVVRDRSGTQLVGSWKSVVVNERVKLQLEFDVLVDISLEWFVYDIGDGKIKLFADDDNKIILKKACGIVDNTPDTLREILKECSWVIRKIEVDDEELDRLLGYEFSFKAEGVVTLSNGTDTSEGTWGITTNAQGRLVMAITMGEEPGVSFEWLLSDLRDKYLGFSIGEDDDYELILERVCDDNNGDGDVVEIRNILREGKWVVAKYMDDGEDETEDYANLDFNFVLNALVTVSTNDVPLHFGLWRVIRNSEGKLKFYLNFGLEASLEDLTDHWRIVGVTENRIELLDVSSDGSVDLLVFERK